jgi:hypothetical protein
MRRVRLALLAWCLICAIVFFTFLPAVLLEPDSRFDHSRAPYAVLNEQWEIGIGPDRPEDNKWKPFDSEQKQMLSEYEEYEGTVWLKHSMPELNWRSFSLV